VPAIENLTQKLMRHPSKKFPSRPLQQIDRIIVHHTAVASTVGAERIAEFLVKNHDRPGISYHYFITTGGVIQQTNLVTAVTLQSTSDYNRVAIGVGFAGNFNEAVPTPQQIESGAQLIAWILHQLKLSPQAVFGHKELVNTQSPGAQWDGGARWGQKLKQQIQAILAG
jgi:N-acetyl-anhydromuramyl-L-alanine amidase AmpD